LLSSRFREARTWLTQGGVSVRIFCGIFFDLLRHAGMRSHHARGGPRSLGVDGLRVCRPPSEYRCQPLHLLQTPLMVKLPVSIGTDARLILLLDGRRWFQKYHRTQSPLRRGADEPQEWPL
jgi:hypothetical protein